MGAAHGHLFHFHAHSPLHRAPAHLKLLALLAFTLTVVATPRGLWWAYAGYALVLASVIALSRVPARYLAPRMLVETPFVVFALLMPVLGHGPFVEIAGLTLSEPGIEAGAALITKGTLGVLASLTFAATTTSTQIIDALARLRVPSLLVEIMSFMLRYLEVVLTEYGRMLIAMRSRGCEPRNPRHWPALARSLGALFIRCYERGERVHVAMLSRGYTGAQSGRMPS
ncbi:cobalt ECF transporter T component CbiQ [Nocardioides sp. R-C-SC26]|uniref:cobalt ECF transporter T component CbiQ n=1 Tax=Nocardioides sp. R-C-SC26 TaxID=2870414 RepID=UPI001E343F6C|nr:cobalt ECF transporter T component CbiQ [Nocardioides sp. R-C-SC26]